MVTRLFFLLLLAPYLLFSGEFTAGVSQNQIRVGENFTLTLTLKDATTKESPYIDSLKKLFFVHSQQQSSNTVMINGRVSSSLTWYVTLMPLEEGEFKIPAMSIDTSEGILLTDPITISVKEGSSSNADSSEMEGVELSSEVSKSSPYKNEPIIYTVRLVAKRSLGNLQLPKVDIDEAIVEMDGEPKIHEKTVNGMRVNIIDFTYLITPLKVGVLHIPPTVIQGSISNKKERYTGSLLDMMQGFDRLEPFTLKTSEISLDVQPAISGITSWLPAQSLKIEEVLDDSQGIREGEPFTRSFKISAEGVRSNQLPSLNDLQSSDGQFKIYADKPEFGDEVKDQRVKSYRKEQYTLIPKKPGSLVLPEITLSWWDVVKKEKATAIIPARLLQVSPLLNEVALESQEPVVGIVVVQRDPVLYIVIAVLVLLLITAIFLGINLRKKIASFAKIPLDIKEKSPQIIRPTRVKKILKKDKNEKLPDLNPT
ncbi:MAG: BatD family protein [Chlamydiota bacterium]